MSETTRKATPQPVSEGATRCGEDREPQQKKPKLSSESLLVWSKRMLEALERGNDKRKWHTLADKVWSSKTLEAALQAVVAIYLDPLDHLMVSAGREMIRYADDFVILCENREEAEATLEAVR